MIKLWQKNTLVVKDVTGDNYVVDEVVDKKATPLSVSRIVIILITYFIGYTYLFPMIILKIFSLITWTTESYLFWATASQFLMCLVTMAIIIVAARPLLKESWYIFKQNIKDNVLIAIIVYGLIIVTNIVVTMFFTLETSANQESIESMMVTGNLLVPFMVVIFAPIVEELVFRGAIYRTIRKKTGKLGSILVSAFIFGLMHVLASLLSGNFTDLINIITYLTMGAYMAYAYEKTGSIHTAMTVHLLNNGIATLILLFL